MSLNQKIRNERSKAAAEALREAAKFEGAEELGLKGVSLSLLVMCSRYLENRAQLFDSYSEVEG